MKPVIGVTGGIGCGKTTATNLFLAHGAAVVDTDEIAHEFTRPGGAAIPAISARFGARYLTADGALDRAAMRRLVFADPAAKADLEAILHPLIRQEAARRVEAAEAPYVLLVVPLLVETGGDRRSMARVLVIDCEEDAQVERVVRRSGLRPEQVRAIMQTQATRAQRLAVADDVLRNDGDEAALADQVAQLHRLYLSLRGGR
jgi:dephospho-CoA kinase